MAGAINIAMSLTEGILEDALFAVLFAVGMWGFVCQMRWAWAVASGLL
jgi:hypothetical protein